MIPPSNEIGGTFLIARCLVPFCDCGLSGKSTSKRGAPDEETPDDLGSRDRDSLLIQPRVDPLRLILQESTEGEGYPKNKDSLQDL